MLDRDMILAFLGGPHEWWDFPGGWLCDGHVMFRCKGIEGLRVWGSSGPMPPDPLGHLGIKGDFDHSTGYHVIRRSLVTSRRVVWFDDDGCGPNQSDVLEWDDIGLVRHDFGEGLDSTTTCEHYARVLLKPCASIGRAAGGYAFTPLVGLDDAGQVLSVVMPTRLDTPAAPEGD